MIVNGKEISIEDIVEDIDINKNIPIKRKNGLILRDSQIEILKKYNIDYEQCSSLSNLIYESEEVEVDVPLSMNVIEGKIPSTIIGSYSI